MGIFSDLRELRKLNREEIQQAPALKQTVSAKDLLKVYKVFGKFYLKYWKFITIAYIALLATIAVEVLKPWPLKLILDHLVLGAPFPEQAGFLNTYYQSNPHLLLLWLSLAVVGIAFLIAVFSYFNKFYMGVAGDLLNADIREHVFAHLQRLSLSFHDQTRSGNLLYTLTNDFKVVKNLLVEFPQNLIERTVTLSMYLMIMLMMDWRLALIGFSGMPLVYACTKFFGKGLKAATQRVRRKLGELSTIVLENMRSMAVIKAYGREKDERDRFINLNQESLEVQLLAARLQRAYGQLTEIFVVLSTAGVLYVGGKYALEGAILPGTLIIFIAYMRDVFGTFQKFNNMYIGLARGLVAVDRLMEVVESDMVMEDAPDAQPAPPLRGRIEFRNVSFGYRQDQQVLKNISFAVEPGETVALVGHSGAGKSTIISLILRFYDPQQGQIFIDGEDVRKYTLKSLRDQITIVLQEAKLFRQTVRENIAFGKIGATDEEIIEAAKAAQAHDFIIEMPQGYDTMMFEGGENLSGGQKQRINLARAIIRDTPIVILDEPATGLDARAEARVNEAMRRLTQGRTTFIIAHKLSTIINADKILLIEEGRLEAIGRHTQLVHESPKYRELYELQFGWQNQPALEEAPHEDGYPRRLAGVRD